MALLSQRHNGNMTANPNYKPIYKPIETKIEATLRIPTAEQYAYIEVKIYDTEDNVVKAYHRIYDKYLKSEEQRKQKEAEKPPF